ncbi:MAG: HPr family phosphocarrier protein [Isosphaeraceae bacterium]
MNNGEFGRKLGGSGTMQSSNHQVEVVNVLGLHLRAADQFARLARGYRAEVSVACGDRRVDGKSVLDLTILAAAKGTWLVIEASGPDADAAVAALIELVAARFHEDGDAP